MKKFKRFLVQFTPFELILWLSSIALILLSFFLCKNTQYLYLAASLVGACALIFVAKGNVWGQILTVAFSVLYGIISYSFRYYGEMITYLGMTAPIALITVFVWLKHPSKQTQEVQIRKTDCKEIIVTLLLGDVVSLIFFFILKALNTANLGVSVLSVFTSFTAVWLTLRRSAFYAIGYALNDIVLIVMWALAAAERFDYLAMVVCFIVFLVNDAYGFFNWLHRYKKQNTTDENA